MKNNIERLIKIVSELCVNEFEYGDFSSAETGSESCLKLYRDTFYSINKAVMELEQIQLNDPEFSEYGCCFSSKGATDGLFYIKEELEKALSQYTKNADNGDDIAVEAMVLSLEVDGESMQEILWPLVHCPWDNSG